MPQRALLEAMARHLPPSATTLRLLDVGGLAGTVLQQLRTDLNLIRTVLDASEWDYESSSIDAVVAYDRRELDKPFLKAVLDVMRPGGRLILVNPGGQVEHRYGRALEAAGYVRILVEVAADSGVLIRGEKPHTTADTVSRIQQIAAMDADILDWEQFKGRYVHLLVRQTPNKPVWKLSPDEVIRWQAVAVDGPVLLAFSSLPKAVGFMQPAVMADFIHDVNKVGKFSRETARTWPYPVLLNPTLKSVEGQAVTLVDIDPETAEAPDE